MELTHPHRLEALQADEKVMNCDHFSCLTDGACQRWEAIVFVSPPVTLFEGVLLKPEELKRTEAEVGSFASPVAGEAAAGWSGSHWEKKYKVKYRVKNLVGELMEGPVGCSTPRPGVIRMSGSQVAGNGMLWNVEALVKKVLVEWDQQGEKVEGEEKKLVERYVYKYFYKLKIKGNF